MSIDTVTKRFSMMHLFGGFCALPSVPDGTITTKDRYSFLSLYSGVEVPSESGGYDYNRDRCHDAIATKKRIRRRGYRGIR